MAAAARQADAGLRQHRGLCALGPGRARPQPLCRRGLQPRLGRRGAAGHARFGRAAARPRAAAFRRCRRAAARHPFDARALRATDGLRQQRSGWRKRRGAVAATAGARAAADRHRPPGRLAHDRTRPFRRSEGRALRGADRVRPALGARRGRRGDGHAAALPGPQRRAGAGLRRRRAATRQPPAASAAAAGARHRGCRGTQPGFPLRARFPRHGSAAPCRRADRDRRLTRISRRPTTTRCW